MNKDNRKKEVLKNYYIEKTSNKVYQGLKVIFNIGERLVIIKSYPHSIQSPKSYMNQKKVIKDLYRILDSGIEQHFPELELIQNEHLITVTEEERIATEKREEAKRQKLIYEQKQAEKKGFNDNPSSIFRFKSSKSLFPNYVEFKPNDTTLNIMKKYIHDGSINELEEHFQFSKEEYFRLDVKNGCIVHFENPNLNIGFMYAINLLNSKMYTVKPIPMPKPLVNLLISGNTKHTIKAATSDPLIRQQLKKLPLRILEKDRVEFCYFVFRHIKEIETFNPYYEKDLDFHIRNKMFRDKNKEQVTKSINRYLSDNHMSMSEFFAVDLSSHEGMEQFEVCRQQLVMIFTMLISKYFKLYIENSIDMAEYTKNDKSSSDTETDNPSPDKKSNGTKMMKNRM
ncbi:hypothetical protein [Moritella viscosa]|uniref:Histidinol-phosphate aminotransferase 1-Imidazole acetol-phosphate transaminase 1 n=1 Tax=Moritella viscosa TaxID=80854 RepID=A0ABY1HN28_9GAMM|nr:hypothetical protein [Moritella viscosa]SGZ02241.1 Histidinol-phosphate aminotransferase 1-Imidazole acetol-phosphate transaminase 1 [Moritella viscosa]SGZ15157.1 Histidinol-phosphate aminotransferase 1-Imidazole acetol-phosphate transaminase 1 [Moritella viscosa]SHO28128.1 Histidinol-phosphate aminotransferase-Imidazole acetol-phosphate transaminase [Moritella viscosa]